MHFIVFDLEFNQDFSSLQDYEGKKFQYPFEIFQIGAIKLDSNFNTISTFNRYVKPTIYTKLNPCIAELTEITTEQLKIEKSFTEVYKSFAELIDEPDSIFCIWGMSDIKVLFRNIEYHQLSNKLLPRFYINLQPYASIYLKLPQNHLIRLQYAVEALNLPITYKFHNALNDAYYTAEIFKKIYNSSIIPRFYDPSYVKIKPRKQKRVIDEDRLIQQFEKMYARKMSEHESELIKLTYKMGRTNQFLK